MPEARRRSLRRQLLVLLLSAVSGAWLIAASLSFFDARHEVAEVFDGHLAQIASLVSVQSGPRDDDDDDEVDTEHAPLLHRYSRRVMFQVWDGGTVLRLHSQNAPNTPLSREREGFSDAIVDGSRWRVFSVWDPRSRRLVQVAEQLYERDELTTAVARNFVIPLVITLPVLGVLIWIAVGRATHSLTHVNQQVASRVADNLAPIDIEDVPAEIGGLVTNLNQLFGRVHGLIEQERHFTADAAHELRTPLAGIRAQAQVARGATDTRERTRALDGVIAGCDRATHAVEQMLTLARLAPDAVSFQPASVDLWPVLRTAIGDLAPFAVANDVDIAVNEGTGATISGDAGLLAILFRNLVDNAIRYSAPGTAVEVDVAVHAADVFVTIRDAGPGIPADQRERLGRRFYRAPGTRAPGSGLGLSIVQRILDLHHGTLLFDTPPTQIGLQVTVALPRSGASPAAAEQSPHASPGRDRRVGH